MNSEQETTITEFTDNEKLIFEKNKEIATLLHKQKKLMAFIKSDLMYENSNYIIISPNFKRALMFYSKPQALRFKKMLDIANITNDIYSTLELQYINDTELTKKFQRILDVTELLGSLDAEMEQI